MIFKKVIIKILSIFLIWGVIGFSYYKNAYASYVPISYVTFSSGDFDLHYTNENLEYFYVPGSWTFTAPSGCLIDSVRFSGGSYQNSNYYYFKIDGATYDSQSNNHYSDWHGVSGQTVTGLNATTVYFQGGDLYLRPLTIGLKSDLADADLVRAAKDAANAAKASADTASTNATSAATNALNAYNAAMYNGQSAAYWSYLAANGVTADTTPPTITKVAGQNNATCTTTGFFSVTVNATDNKFGQLQAQAQVDGGAWTGWFDIPQGAIPITLTNIGVHTINVNVKDTAGNMSSASMTAFRL